MVIQTGFNWLIEQQLLLSMLFGGFILLERCALKALGAGFIYKVAWLLPIALVISNLPNTLKPLQNSAISYYFITPKQIVSDQLSINWALLYAVITAALLIAAIVIHRRFVTRLQLIEVTQFTPAITSKVATYTSTQVASPMVIGTFTSKLVLPHNFMQQFDNATLALILEHENMHIKRKDNLINALILLPTILLWFNPLAWMCYASIRRLQELTCDERVLANKTTHQHILYSKALLTCAANVPTGLMAYSHYGDKETMLQRLENIKHGGRRSLIAKGGLLLIATSMLSGLAIAQQPQAKLTTEQHIKPIMRIEPMYPKQAAAQGISGSVVLKYDITAAGNTTNVTIIKEQPAATFSKAAKQALLQWQYQPSSMGYTDVLVQLDFALNSEVPKHQLIERLNVSH